MSPARPLLAALACCCLAIVGCSVSDGGACEIDRDCQSGICCGRTTTTRGVCYTAGTSCPVVSVDGGTSDSGAPGADAGTGDGGAPVDAGVDAGGSDSGAADSGAADAGAQDAGTGDAGSVQDAGAEDGGGM